MTKNNQFEVKKSRGNPGLYFGAPGGFPRYPQLVDTCGAFVSTQTAPKACFRLLIVERVRIQISGCTITKQIPTNKSWGFILAHPARFERAIPAFGGRCSIQLSHGCQVPTYYKYMGKKSKNTILLLVLLQICQHKVI